MWCEYYRFEVDLEVYFQSVLGRRVFSDHCTSDRAALQDALGHPHDIALRCLSSQAEVKVFLELTRTSVRFSEDMEPAISFYSFSEHHLWKRLNILTTTDLVCQVWTCWLACPLFIVQFLWVLVRASLSRAPARTPKSIQVRSSMELSSLQALHLHIQPPEQRNNAPQWGWSLQQSPGTLTFSTIIQSH